MAAENALPAGYPTLEHVPSVPTVLLKAIAWIESGWQQFAAPGEPLVSRDGGYGVMQVTHGLGGIPISATLQSAIANNFIYNIACGARLLSLKWATTPRIGSGDPTVLEDWYYAVWAYNNWSWRNNPNNPVYTRKGTPISNPFGFPYQDRVFYLVSHPPLGPDGLPLWTAVPATLPDPKSIGKTPAALPMPAEYHNDAAPADGPLLLSRYDAMEFKSDLSVPDNTIVAAGTPLHKVWLLHNAGGLFWSGYTWRFVRGDRMAAPISVTLPLAPPLSDVPIGVDLVAPTRPGQHKGYWQLYTSAGVPMGPPAWVSLAVADAAQATALAQATATATAGISSLTSTALISQTLDTPPATAGTLRNLAPSVTNNAAYVADLTIPDGTIVAPGQAFTKTWEIQNTGASAWDSRYHWTFQAGAPMGSAQPISAPSVPPGATVRFSVHLVAPTRPGTYRGFWQMTDPSGNVFGSQVTVIIKVQAPGSTATATPTVTTPPTATPTATAQPAPSSTPQPTATSRPSPTASATPQPHQAPLAWFGPPASSAFFAEGYTGDGYHEYLSLLNPRARSLRAQLVIYRIDGATRTIALTLGALARRSLDLNVLAPEASTAMKVEADAPVVVERGLFMHNGHVVAGASAPSRRWYMAEAYVGAGYRDELRIFNPGYLSTGITIKAFRSDGSVLMSHRSVAAGVRVGVPLDDVATIGASALEVDSAEPVVVESVVRGPHASGPGAAMGITAPSRAWYFPDGGTTRGNQEYIALLNPGSVRSTVHLRLVTPDGYQAPLTLHVGPHARAVYVVQGFIHLGGLAAEIDADQPIVAQEIRYASSGGVSVLNGAPRPARRWGLAEGHTSDGFKEWLAILNPGAGSATVAVRLIPQHGAPRTVTLAVGARQRTFLYLNHLIAAGPVSAIVNSDRPIVVGRTMIFNAERGLSTTLGVALGE